MPATGSSKVPAPTLPKCTLVPVSFLEKADPRCILSDLYPLTESEKVEVWDVPGQDAVLVYAGQTRPALCSLLEAMGSFSDYNKILVHLEDSCLSVVIAQGNSLLLANCFPAADFTTAEYFIFYAMKSFQLNTEVSTVRFFTPLTAEEEMSLYRYFKSVEQL